MAGKLCPSCGKMTFFKSNTGRKCTNCGYEMIVPANSGKGGQGKRCYNCDRMTVFNGVCRSCGATYR